jgi:transcriptional regulator with XRE-family HTH domain
MGLILAHKVIKERIMERKYLINIRIYQKKSQQIVSENMGISQNYYSAIENGERQKDMSLSLMEKLAGAFNLPLDEIIKAEKEYKRTIGQKGA